MICSGELWRRVVRKYHIFLARQLARLQHHHHRRMDLNPMERKERKERKGLGDMLTGGLCSKTSLWQAWMMVERDPAVYGLVSRRRS